MRSSDTVSQRAMIANSAHCAFRITLSSQWPNGHLGKLERIEIVFPSDPTPVGVQPDMPVPPELNYDMWLGPTAAVPYTEKSVCMM